MQAIAKLKFTYAFWEGFLPAIEEAILSIEAELQSDKKNYALKAMASSLVELRNRLKQKLCLYFTNYTLQLSAPQALALHQAWVEGYLTLNQDMYLKTMFTTKALILIDKAVG